MPNFPRRYVRGIAVTPYGEHYITCSDDKTIKQWALEKAMSDEAERVEPLHTWMGSHAFTMGVWPACNTYRTCRREVVMVTMNAMGGTRIHDGPQ
jgi:hypothetical protein